MDVNEFCRHFTHSPQESIDAWLGKPGSQPYVDIGKFAIARVLLQYEKTQFLFSDIVSSHLPSTDPDHKPKRCWYRQLYKAIDTHLEDFHNNKLSVITFNYDRSLEHFIYTSLRSDNLDKSEAEIAQAANSLEVLHVHGRLGYLPWQNQPHDPADCEVPFNTHDGLPDAAKASKYIKIIHEADISDTEFAKARGLLRDAERIYIIGFGFDQTNLKRLGIKDVVSRTLRHIAATTWDISRRQQDNIVRYLEGPVANTAFISFYRHDQTAYDFLYNTVLFD